MTITRWSEYSATPHSRFQWAATLASPSRNLTSWPVSSQMRIIRWLVEKYWRDWSRDRSYSEASSMFRQLPWRLKFMLKTLRIISSFFRLTSGSLPYAPVFECMRMYRPGT